MEYTNQKTVGKFYRKNVIDKTGCANLLSDMVPNGRCVLENHIKDYNEILLHLLADELVCEPLIDLLKHHKDGGDEIEKYCKVIEVIWKNGDDSVKNVVDVTILERLSDEELVWEKFGKFISEEFKHYINTEVLRYNFMMGGVKPLA